MICKQCKDNYTEKNLSICLFCIDKYDIRQGLEPKWKPTDRVNVYSSIKPFIKFEMKPQITLYKNKPSKGVIKSVNHKEQYAIVKLDNYATDRFIVPFQQMKKLVKKKSNKYIWVKFYGGNNVVEYTTSTYNSKIHKDWIKYKKVL